MRSQDRRSNPPEHAPQAETDSKGRTSFSKQVFYEIKVQGQLEHHWSEWFDNLTVRPDESGYTTLSGPVPDQAALHGILARIRDLGLPLLSLRRISDADER